MDGTGHLIGLAALEASGDGWAGMAVVRSTMLVPMVKRKRWWRLVFRLKQEVVVNFRWIGTTVALAAVAGWSRGRGHMKTSAMVAQRSMVTPHCFENVAYRQGKSVRHFSRHRDQARNHSGQLVQTVVGSDATLFNHVTDTTSRWDLMTGT